MNWAATTTSSSRWATRDSPRPSCNSACSSAWCKCRNSAAIRRIEWDMPDALTPASILIVDDNEGTLRLIQKALQREGYSAVTAGSGKEAIAWLLRHRADLMLLDLKLPDIEGKAL